MSGGHYDYKYHRVEELADDIERDFLNGGKYQDTDWDSNEVNPFGERGKKEYDRIGDATPEQREIILAEITKLIEDLKQCSFRAKELEWYMSGDTGADSYLERLKAGRK